MSESKYYWTGRSNDPAEEFGAVLRYTSSGGFEFSENSGSSGYSSLKNKLLGMSSSGGEMSFLNQQGNWLNLSAGKGIAISSGNIGIQAESCSSGAVLTAVSGGSSLQWCVPEVNAAVMSSAIASAVSGLPGTLSALSDVSAGTVSSGNVLQYNGSAWVPDALPETSCYGSAMQGTGSAYEVSGGSSFSGRYAWYSGSGSNAVYISGGNSLCRNYAESSGYRWEIVSSAGGSSTILAFQTVSAASPEQGLWNSAAVRKASALYVFPLNTADEGKIFSVKAENGSAYAEMVEPGTWEEKYFFIGSGGNCSSLADAAVSAGNIRKAVCTLLDSTYSGSDTVTFSAKEVVIARSHAHETAGTMPSVSTPLLFRNMGNIVISGVGFRFSGSSGLTFDEGCHGRLENVVITSGGSALAVSNNAFVHIASQVVLAPENSIGICASAFGKVYAEEKQLVNAASSGYIPARGTQGNGGAWIEYAEPPAVLGFVCSGGGVMTSAGFHTADNVLSSGEVMTVAEQGSVIRPVIQSGAVMIVSSGGTVCNAVLSGTLSCTGGGLISGITGSGCILDIGSGGTVSGFSGYGSVTVRSYGILSNSVISGGSLTVESKGSAVLVDTESGTHIHVYSGGRLVNRRYEGDTYTSDYIIVAGE